MLWMFTALAAPSVDAVQPTRTRAGFPRFDDPAFADPDGIDAVRGRLDRSVDPVERAALTDWLARLTLAYGSPHQVESLQQLGLTSVHPEVQVGVIERSVRSDHGAPLLPLLSSSSPEVRRAAVHLIGSASASERSAYAQGALLDADPTVQVAALRAVRTWSIQLPTLVEAQLDSTASEVRLQAALTLETLHPQRFEALRTRLERDADLRIQRLAR